MTPQTDREWAKLIARSVVHPDVGGDIEAFLRLQEQREAWRQQQPRRCRRFGCHGVAKPRARWYCSNRCHLQTLGDARRKRRTLKPARLVRPATAQHQRHAAVFGAFARCQHTACVQARRGMTRWMSV
jgi:hypothetical protein